MRGVWAITVFLYHLISFLGRVSNVRHGYIAVDAFFIISGFVIAASYEQRLRDGLPVSRFLRARIERLGPTYWFALALGAMSWGFIAIGLNHWHAIVIIQFILICIALESLLIPSIGSTQNGFILNGPAWSIFGELVVNCIYAQTVKWLNKRVLVALAVAGWLATTVVALSYQPRGWDFGWSGNYVLLSPLRAVPAFAIGVIIYR